MAEPESFPNARRAAHGTGVVAFRSNSAVSPYAFEPQPAEAEAGGEFDARQFLGMLLRRAWLIVGILFLGLAGATGYVLSVKPQYRAVASVEVQRQESQIIKEGEVQPMTIADREHMATQIALLRSRTLAERVAELLDLPSDADYAPASLSRADRLSRATTVVMGKIQVAPVAQSRVIEIRYESTDPQEAARVANTLVDSFIQTTLERRYNATAYARTFLEERLASTKASLEEAERKLVAYSRSQKILDLSAAGGTATGGSLDATSLVALNQSLSTAQAERIEAEQRFNQVRANGAARESLSSQAISEMRSERAKLFSEYQEKSSRFTPEFPEMKELAAQIKALDEELATERGSILSVLEGEYRAALGRETALRARVEELKNQVQDVRTRSIDYTIIAREVDTLRSQYDALLQRFKEVSIASGLGTSQVSIVDRAEAPRKPFSPNLPRTLLLAAVLSMMLGVGLAMILEYLDDTIKHPDDIKNKLGLALIGVTPKLNVKEEVINQLGDPRSTISEAFASARTALQFATDSGAPKTMLVTGMRPSEGKTSSATGLAVSFGNVGRRVLIIDADMRRPSFTTDPGASIGLSGLLTSEAPLRDNVVAGAVENVFLLPAGVIPPNPAELLSGPRLGRILEEASLLFDIVIVDSPPVLGFADAPLLSTACECTVVVIQAGGIRRPTALRTLERLDAARANIVGVILTKFDTKKSGDSIAYGYGYQYAYKYRVESTEADAEKRLRKRVSLFAGGDAANTGRNREND